MFDLANPTVSLRNDDAAKSDRLVGAKAQAVKNILAMGDSSRQQIMLTVSTFGWDGTWAYKLLFSDLMLIPHHITVNIISPTAWVKIESLHFL